MSETMIAAENVAKTYANGKEALKGVSFTIKKGEFVALLGPNGAGKSTFINILAGNNKKSAGNVAIAGLDLETHEIDTKRRIGIVPQEVGGDMFFTVNEALKHQAGYFGMTENVQARIDELLEILTLTDKKHVNMRALSGGMKRRLLIAKSIIHDPDIIVLDEPTAGVDIELRNSLYKFLRKLHAAGKTIILTTHYLEEAEQLCDRIMVINHGKLITDKPKSEFLKLCGGAEKLEDVFLKLIKTTS